ncbi:LacI family DNA-binding transcriptional regulator [Clostridium thermarum]|uniref:LacI family DNA-binding transcriptional regulator n=1 Tax=Clostridium thermarum TaxID=1716543 RepID=UPI00111CBDF5|nr:LacI family DNA-binding transcriptional regulator [Clostridium thermarum]
MKSEDIARLCGVSRSTVSRVINNYPNVPQETREKVLAAIEKYNYQPHISARVLAGKGTNTIGLFVISTADTLNKNRIFQNSFFSPFINAVVDYANSREYYVLVHTIYEKKDYNKIKEVFLQKRVDGCIILGTENETEIINEIQVKGLPISIIDYDEENAEKNTKYKLNVVNSMDYEGSKEALRYLISLGHKKIGIITGRMNTFSGRQRYKAYRETLLENGLQIDERFVLNGKFLKHIAYREVEKLIENKVLPSAIFACNDDMAIAAMEAFHNNGISVPQDISIIGFDDIPFASMTKPPLTTVAIPIYEMAQKAVEGIIDLEERNYKLVNRIPTNLKIRGTCREY